MIGFPSILPIEATRPRDWRVAEDVTLPSLEMIDGPVLVVPLSDAEAPAVRAWIERGGPRKPPTTVRHVTPENRLMVEIMAELTRARAKFPGDNVTFAALVEEVDELATATFSEPAARVRAEAVQVAVMAMRMVLDGDNTSADWREINRLDPLIAPPASPSGQNYTPDPLIDPAASRNPTPPTDN